MLLLQKKRVAKGMKEVQAAQAELYENIIASLDEGIVVLDRDLTVVTFNQAAQEMFGVLTTSLH